MSHYNQEKLSFTTARAKAEPPQAQYDRRSRYYLALLNSQLSLNFPKFVHNLQAQSPIQREWGRAAVLEHFEGICSKQEVFRSSTDLQRYMDQQESATAPGPRRRLFLLEDLSRNYIEVLGSLMDIPPKFFAAHWEDPTAASSHHRDPFVRFSENQFTIRYASSQPVSIETAASQQTNVYAWDANVNRYLFFYDPNGPLVDDPKSYHILSFWTSGTRHDGSWDALLLVDPPVGNCIRAIPTFEPIRINCQPKPERASQNDFPYPELRAHRTLSEETLDQFDIVAQPSYVSMFDDILSIAQTSDYQIGKTPRSSTYVARKLAISIFLAFLRRRYLNTLRLQSQTTTGEPLSKCGYLRNFDGGPLTSWHHEVFGFITNVRSSMMVLIKEVEDNMTALGLDRNAVDDNETLPIWEYNGWRVIHESSKAVLQMADMFSASYLQFISIQEARLSNENANSLARITILTTFFIPLSTIAAIFSMDEEFSPGKRKHWIFWVVSLPTVLLLIFVYRDKGRFSRAFWRRHTISKASGRRSE